MNQHSQQIFVLFLLATFLFPVGMWAQSSVASPEEILENNTRAFAKAYASLPETKDKKAVMDFFHPRYQSVIFYFSVSDKFRSNTSSYDGFDRYLGRIANTPGMSIGYDVQEILYTYVKDNVATIVFNVAYETKEENGFHVRGLEAVTMGWKKFEDTWKIVHFTVLGTEDEKLRGSCLCEIFASRGDDYVVRTTVPDGKSYTTGFSEFETNTIDGETYIRASDNTYFKLNKESELWEMTGNTENKDNMTEVRRLGSANEVKGAMLLIVKSHIYPDNCTSIKFVK